MRFAVAEHGAPDETVVAQVMGDPARSDLPAAQKAALQLADAFSNDAAGQGEQAVAACAQEWSAAGAVDAAMVMVKCRAFAKVQIALGLEPQSMAVTVV